jgi:acyl transferase domain-containing protein
MSDQPIAIIGMAGRFPGASSITEYWENLRDGVSSIRARTDEELLAAGVTPEELADPAYVRVCPMLADVDQFDARFFGLNPRDAAVMDPAHRHFMEVAWEALEHAGQAARPEEGAVGVFATSGAPYYLMDNVRRNADLLKSMGEFPVRHTNNDMNFLATRVSYELDLRGPSINIQTACSSALVAVHMACESIRRGECTMALAGGSTVNVPHGHGYMYRDGEILSPDGVCRPFDANSAGTVFGSGTGCVC